MAGVDSVSGDSLAALLFLQASMNTLDAYSTLNSSPWTAESFGADERRSKALKEYVGHAVVYSAIYSVIAAVITQSSSAAFWIIAGSVITNVYLVWLYMRASKRGRDAGSENWDNPG